MIAQQIKQRRENQISGVCADELKPNKCLCVFCAEQSRSGMHNARINRCAAQADNKETDQIRKTANRIPERAAPETSQAMQSLTENPADPD